MAEKQRLYGRTRYEIAPYDIREAIATHLKVKYGVTVIPERVVLFDGNEIEEYLVVNTNVEHLSADNFS